MTTPAPQSASDIINSALASWGLSSLSGAVNGYVTQGLDANQALLQLRQTPEYKTRFAGNTQRLANGLAPLSEADYLSKEDSLREQFRLAGLPPGFYDQPDDFAKAIGSDLGAQELSNRLSAYQAVVSNGQDSGVFSYAQQHYGLGQGDMLAYFIDPDRAAPLLTKMAAASQLGAAAAQTGFGDISTADAEKLADQGVSQSQALSGFSQAASLQGLTNTVGDSQGLTKDDLESAIFGQDAGAQQKVQRTQDTRTAAFKQGGGYAATNKGVTGLGSAAT